MRAALLALAVATLASGTAGAQAVVDTAGRETVQVRTRPDAAGDVLTDLQDGRVLSLEERRVTRARTGSPEAAVTITRRSARPAC